MKEYTVVVGGWYAYPFYLNLDTGDVHWGNLAVSPTVFRHTLQNVYTPQDFRRTYPELLKIQFWLDFLSDWESALAKWAGR